MRRFCVALLIITFVNCEVAELPSARSSPLPVQVFEGDDVLITCVVRSLRANTVMWKREASRPKWDILTVGHNRVTEDERFQVIHDDGGDVWVLVIKNATIQDAGMYKCEVNSKPPISTFHRLTILAIPQTTIPPDGVTGTTEKPPNHNYTDCCVALNVSRSCLGFCNIQSILEGTTGQDPENCEADFPSIVRCMADGRNHVPCCIDEGVPDICQDVCRGEYTMITDNIKTHFSCASYTELTLACIVEGVELLPSWPLNVQVVPLSDSSFGVEWMEPFNNPDSVTHYVVNVTMIRTFAPSSFSSSQWDNSSQSIVIPHSVQVDVRKTDNQSNYVVIKELSPYTMYEVTLIAKNKHGSSLPSNAVRSLTLTPGQKKVSQNITIPKLPDVKSCCVEQGIKHEECLDTLCGTTEIANLMVSDMMICAPWASKSFKCMANGIDHTPCCRAREIPDVCQDLCSGNVTQLNHVYFKCIKFIPTYRDCLMQGYGVLPGAPIRAKITNIDLDFAIITWDPPKILADSVTSYHVHYRTMKEPLFHHLKVINPPLILEQLKSDTLYEVYISASNVHGTGEPSQRILFSTQSRLIEAKLETVENTYNITACCVNVGLSANCMPLCSYDASMTQLKALATLCSSELSKLIRCGTGGRNHGPCCARRGVPSSCSPLCSGVVAQSLYVTKASCVPYIGNIVQCFEEGTGRLPGPISEMHAFDVTDTSVALAWEGPKDGANTSDYVIYYKKVDKTSVHETVVKLENQVNTTSTTYVLKNLEPHELYKIFVVSRNEHGTSLPSSILLINITKTDLGETGMAAVTSPPHTLAVSDRSAQYVTITWQPPEFSHPDEKMSYTVFYKESNSQSFTAANTSVTSHTLEQLKPNTQYILYVTAKSGDRQSLPSETLIAWTDPAYPAFVEPPSVHPLNLLVEGSSMTVLCIAMGIPMPTISLYISGRLVRQEVTRHMVTVIYNITRDMKHISCYADNGYGTPMEARKLVNIKFKPRINTNGISMVNYGDSITLVCTVEANPDPQMVFWRDFTNRVPVIQSPKYEVNIHQAEDDDEKWLMELTIKSVSDNEGGDYFCHAENPYGNATIPSSVRLRNIAPIHNVTQCCIEQKVSPACSGACSFYLDIDSVIDRPECLPDFDKFMKCGSDGSDHRSCCAQANIDRDCLDWCRGDPVDSKYSKYCLAKYMKKIMSCFKEGQNRLPGPPQNVKVDRIDDHTVIVRWDQPLKNPSTVETYRISWRPQSLNGVAMKEEVKSTSIRITGLKSGVDYECVIRAVNVKGASSLTDPIRFNTAEKYIISEGYVDDDRSQFGMASGLVFVFAFVVAAVAAGVWYIRNRSLIGHKSTGGVAFENPSYLREVNMDNIQPNDANSSNSANNLSWRQEQLHVPSSTEVAPSIYEELKLGQDGAGFKRLKP